MILALNVSWAELKTIQNSLNATIYYALGADTSIFVCIASPLFYASTVLDVSDDLTDFNDHYLSDSISSETPTGAIAIALSKRTSTESLPVSIKSRDESNFLQWTIVSHDYTDKTTWYQRSTQVTNETLTGTVSNTIFTSTNTYWINPDHPKLYNQSYNRGSAPYDQVALWMPDGSMSAKADFRPVVSINNVVQTSGYSIDYATGSVYFPSTVAGTVKATYFKPTTSDFIITPAAGVVWQIPRVEVNTTNALILNATTYFQYWRDPTMTFSTSAYMLAEMPYQTFAQMQASATTGADIYPPIGGTGTMSPSAENGWGRNYLRGTDQSSVIIPWNYRKPFVMKASQYDAIRVFTSNDATHLGADYITATFYVEQTPEG